LKREPSWNLPQSPHNGNQTVDNHSNNSYFPLFSALSSPQNGVHMEYAETDRQETPQADVTPATTGVSVSVGGEIDMDDDDDEGASQLLSPYNRVVYPDHSMFASSMMARLADHPFSFPLLSSFPVEAAAKHSFESEKDSFESEKHSFESEFGSIADAMQKLNVSTEDGVLKDALQVPLPNLPADEAFHH